jgi:methylated-DNA-protein-cysteine methyltransferase-like protein
VPSARALPFTRKVRALIRAVPRGRVASYGQIAALAGDPRQARQVAWILHASSEAEGLPWHRVLSARGCISLPAARGGREQARLLRAEGVRVAPGGRVDLETFLWRPKGFSRTSALETLDLEKF